MNRGCFAIWMTVPAMVLSAACGSEDAIPGGPPGAGNGGGGAAGVSGTGGGPAGIAGNGGGAGDAGTRSVGGAGAGGEAGAGGAGGKDGGRSDGGDDAGRDDAREGGGDALGDEGPAGPPGLRWLGRVQTTANGARISWPGTGFVARFDGTAARVTLTTSIADFFQVIVDGQAPTVLATQQGAHDYTLAAGLSAGEHTVTLWRRTEPLAGAVDVGAVTFTGTLLAPPGPSNKRLEIVGDSISVGYGIQCATQNEAFTYATESNYIAYGSLVARELGAEIQTLAWSGIGMYRDVGGSTTAGPPASPQMPVRYLSTIPSDNASTWDFAKYTPGAVVVHLGTNDFAQGDPGQPFVDAYVDFVAAVRSRYATARIYAAVSPMLGGDRHTAMKTYLSQILAARAAKGDSNMVIVDFDPVAANAWACGHPNAATHVIMAGVLSKALKADLGW